MSVLGVATAIRNTLCRGNAKMCSVVCLQHRLSGYRTFSNLNNRCKLISSFQVHGAVAWSADTVCLRNDKSATLSMAVYRIRTNVLMDSGRYFSARPLRDVQMEKGQRDDIPDGITRIPSELCLVSGKSASICSCSCCTEKRTQDIATNSVSSAVYDESKEKGDAASSSSQSSIDDSSKKSIQDVASVSPVKQPGLLKRFHMMYKQYGLVMFCVHWSLASVWTGMFYYAAISGVDIVPLLKWIGASDAVIAPFLRPSIGHAAVTYLMYKLATPVRYTITIAGTQLAVKYLRQWGYMKSPQPDDSLRSLVKDGRAKVKDKMEEVRDKVEDKMDVVRDKIETVRDKVEDKLDDIRDDVHELKGKLDNFRSQRVDEKNVQSIQTSKQQKM